MQTPIPEVRIGDVLERYDVLLLDAYGVLVHSAGALPEAAALLDALAKRRARALILTNDASRLPVTIARRFQGFGLPISPEQVITSGALLQDHFARHGLRGARCAVLGTEDSCEYVRQAGGRIVPAAEPFDALVVSDDDGYPFLDTVNAALSTLFRLVDRGKAPHLLLPNPDLIFPMGDGGFGITSGSIALVFEAALQLRYPGRDFRFVRLGKPYPAMFAEAERRTGTRNMLMIGDQVETDIRGAKGYGLDSALVATGVTGSLASLPEDARPTYLLRSIAP
jgi:HAD superfamily hydrolase (TIGR01450 family)